MREREPRIMYARYIRRVIDGNRLNREVIAERLGITQGAFDALLLQPPTVQQNADILGVVYELISEGEQYAS